MSVVDLRDQQVLDALRCDRDECGEGLPLEEIATIGGTRYPRSVIRRLNRDGYQVGESARGLFQLGHVEPDLAASTGASGSESADPPSVSLQSAPGAPVDVAPRLFDPFLLEAA